MSREIHIRPDVSLVPLGLEHAEQTFRWVCDPLVRRNIGLRSSPSLERTQEWISGAPESDRHPFAILVAGAHVGNVVLDLVDRYLSTARLSIYVGDSGSRGSGVGSSAIALALREAFAGMGLNKVWLTVHSENMPAISAYYRAGFKLEGLLREEFVLDGRRTHAMYMGILRAECEHPAPQGVAGGPL
jgi:RimJ/RimL family protein N-acetyltransferase